MKSILEIIRIFFVLVVRSDRYYLEGIGEIPLWPTISMHPSKAKFNPASGREGIYPNSDPSLTSLL